MYKKLSNKIEHIVLQDVDEQHAPPSQHVLQLEVIPKGGPGRLATEIISLTIAKLDSDGRTTTLERVANVCVSGDSLNDAINLLRRANT